MRSRHLSVLLAATVLLAAGCGGGDKAPTKAQYGQNASRVCNQLEQKTNAAAAGSPTTPAQISAYADRVAKALDDGVQALDNVQRPAGQDGKNAKAYVDELRKQIDTEIKPALTQLKAAAAKKDTAAVQAAAQKIRAVDDTRIKALARAAGATGCA
jgi:predicted NBD/HSP70 family sugar kinase